MVDYHVTPTSVTSTVEQMYHYHNTHRILQQGNSTPEKDREDGLISIGLLTCVILLSLSMFLCNALAVRFCPGSGALANSDDANNTSDETTMHGLPYSSEIRQRYLEASLKSQEFSSMIISDTSATAAAAFIDIEKGHSAEVIAGTKSMIQKAEEGNGKSIKGENDTTYDLDDVYCKASNESHDSVNDDDGLPQCLICFEAFKNGDAVTTHCTDKVYHRHCIMEWLLKHNNCPYCRRPFFHAVTATSTDTTATPVLVASAIVPTRGIENSPSSTSR